MKGYTKIELTNVHTGEKEVVEKHNIITNNLAEYYKLYTNFGHMGYRYYADVEPLYNLGMGGIILFSNSLPEDATKFGTLLTSVDDITGCGFNNVNITTDTKIGNKNMTESKLLDNGYKYVWDFGTSQANGVIASVGLTHSDAGCLSGLAYACPEFLNFYSDQYNYNPYTYGYGLYLNLPNIVTYNFDNNTFMSIYIVDSTTINVVEYKLYMNQQHFINDPDHAGAYKLSKISEVSITSPYQLSLNGSWLNGFDGYYYYISTNPVNVARISASTFAFDTTYGLKSATISSLPTYSLSDISTYMAIANGYLYYTRYKSSYTYELYKVDLSTLSKVTQLNFIGRTGSEVVSDGRLIYAAGYLIFPDDSIIAYGYTHSNSNNPSLSGYFTSQSISSNAKIIISDDRTKFVSIAYKPNHTTDKYLPLLFGYFKNNLCTINNLSSSVVKTADKTMKITYTITEGE